MAEQPLATESTSTGQLGELQKITAILADSKAGEEAGLEHSKKFNFENNALLQDLLGVSGKSADESEEISKNTKQANTQAVTFTKILGDMKGIAVMALDDARRAAKAALRDASKIDPSKYMKAMADKTKKFAGDLLGLLMKGGVLIGLALLLEWLASQDWEAWWNEWGPKIKEKWEEFKTTFTNFYNDNKAIFDSLAALGALSIEWKALEWLGKTTSPIVKLKAALGKIFAVATGSIALLLVEVTAWAGKKLFNITTGTLSLLWNQIKKIFGLGGSIVKLTTTVTEWVGKGLFNITTSTLALLWKEITKIFGAGKTIALLTAKVTEWLGKGLFGVTTSTLVLLWDEIKKLFGTGGKIATFITTVTDWTKTTMFGDTGHLTQVWKEIKKIFGPAGKLNGLFTVVSEWARKQWFDDGGDIRQAWKKITDIFGPDGKLGLFRKWIDGLGDVIMFDDAGDMRKSWKWIKDIFGAGGKIAQMYKALPTEITWFDEAGDFRKIWTFIKGIFGPSGKIAGAFLLVKDAEDWWNDKHDLVKLGNWLRNLFGPTGKIGQALIAMKNMGFGWFDEGGEIRKLFTWFGSLFGKESAISKFIGTLSGWVKTFSGWFATGADAAGKGINGFFDFFGDIIGKVKGFVTAVANNPIIQGIKKFFAGIIKVGAAGASWIGRFFAPIGWIMAIFEAISGFWDGFKEKNEDDTRTFGEKIMDGMKGAIKSLVDFFVIDLAMMIQNILNWAIEKINDLGGWIPGFDGFEKFTFADDLQRGAHALIDKLLPDSLGDVDKDEKAMKEGQVAARKNLAGLGLGALNKDKDEFIIDAEKLKSMMGGMDTTALAKLATKLKMVEDRRGISSKEGQADWEQILATKLKTLDKEQQEAFKGTAAVVSAPQNFYGGGGGGVAMRLFSKDESAAVQATKQG